MDKPQIFIAMAIAFLAGLVLYEHGQANKYAETSAYYASQYRNALKENNKLLKENIELLQEGR